VVEVVREAKRYLGKEVRLLIGGFHLQALSEGRLATIIAHLKALGVAQVAPSHCTGERAMALFRQAWGKDFLEGGCGAVIEVRL
jgi:7,8-dihydropterin-6-yl-methyl-4-(beta-D-ribofuranosyl)aminobenzene 5'-phosphate synthase